MPLVTTAHLHDTAKLVRLCVLPPPPYASTLALLLPPSLQWFWYQPDHKNKH